MSLIIVFKFIHLKLIFLVFLKNINLFNKGAASKIKIITNFDLCLIPVPKFPTPTANINK